MARTTDDWDYWFKWKPAKYRADTLHLTAAQDGMYRRLIDHYMETRQAIPNSDAVIARISGVDLDSCSHDVAIVKAFFAIGKDGRLHLKECDLQLDNQNGKSISHAERGRKGAEARWNGHKSDQQVNGSSHGKRMAKASLRDAREDKNREEKNTPLPPMAGGDGDLDLVNGDVGAPGTFAGTSYNVESQLSDGAVIFARSQAPGWDIRFLMREYDRGIAEGRRRPPNNPSAAFGVWVKAYTKGKPPP